MAQPPWNLAANFKVREFTVNLLPGTTKILAENSSRVAVHFGYGSGPIPNVTLRPGDYDFRGIPIGLSNLIRLTFHDDGPVVQQAMWITTSDVGVVTIWETTLIKDPCSGESGGSSQTYDAATGLPP